MIQTDFLKKNKIITSYVYKIKMSSYREIEKELNKYLHKHKIELETISKNAKKENNPEINKYIENLKLEEYIKALEIYMDRIKNLELGLI